MTTPVDLDAWELWFALHDDICEEAGLRTLSDIVAGAYIDPVVRVSPADFDALMEHLDEARET